MTDPFTRTLPVFVLVFFVLVATDLRAADDVTIYQPPPSSSSSATSTDGTTPVHKSHKKKKKPTTASTTDSASGTASTTTPDHSSATEATGGATAVASTSSSVKKSSKKKTHSSSATAAKKATPTPVVVTPAPLNPPINQSPISAPAFQVPAGAVAPPLPSPTSFSSASTASSSRSGPPVVETGLPIARRGSGTSAGLIVTPSPLSSETGLYRSPPVTESPLPAFVSSPSSSAAGSTSIEEENFKDTDFQRSTHTYPWKSNIFTTMFYIGEGRTTISATDNKASSWDEEWEHSNGGVDDPNDRDGYAAGSHASTVNPFYVALPFNDLAFPDKARRWLPEGWYKPQRPGEKPQSACKGRWVEIKNAKGDVCYAQWEDVGPLRYDHAEYVFGPERPDTYTRAGLDVSPAVFSYLGLDGGRNRLTSWRFVDDGDVPPGKWLKYNELAVIYQAIKEQSRAEHSGGLQIQRAEAPLEDPDTVQLNENRVKAAR